MASTFSQAFPPSPSFTEASLGDLQGKVYIVTGGSGGLGLELTKILYSRNGTVYVATRSASKAEPALEDVRKTYPDSTGKLVFLHCDLTDLVSVKVAATEFLSRETTLQVLFHNAGVLTPPQGSVTKQGYELQMGVHCIAPFLLTTLLEGVLKSTALGAPEGEVRLVWVSSVGASLSDKGGIDLDNLDYHVDKTALSKYGISKVGMYWLAGEFGRRLRNDKIISVALDPGNLKTNLQRDLGDSIGRVGLFFLNRFLHPAIKGAYTELFAGLSPQVTLRGTQDPAIWIHPWGRMVRMARQDLIDAFSPPGSGNAAKFWEWCREQVEKNL